MNAGVREGRQRTSPEVADVQLIDAAIGQGRQPRRRVAVPAVWPQLSGVQRRKLRSGAIRGEGDGIRIRRLADLGADGNLHGTLLCMGSEVQLSIARCAYNTLDHGSRYTCARVADKSQRQSPQRRRAASSCSMRGTAGCSPHLDSLRPGAVHGDAVGVVAPQPGRRALRLPDAALTARHRHCLRAAAARRLVHKQLHLHIRKSGDIRLQYEHLGFHYRIK